MYIPLYVCVCIYIYIERERERDIPSCYIPCIEFVSGVCPACYHLYPSLVVTIGRQGDEHTYINYIIDLLLCSVAFSESVILESSACLPPLQAQLPAKVCCG